jgi:hypothetical protein
MRNFTWLLISALAFFSFSCEKEEETVSINNENSFTKTAPVTYLVKRVSQLETTIDNVLDNTSCFKIKLPVEVTVDNQTITVSNSYDYHTIEDIKETYNYDDDVVNFSFPIVIEFADFHTVTVSNLNQYNAIKSQCSDDSNFHEIACINFNYPITINNYDTENQVGNTVTIQNDTQLYNYMDDMLDTAVVGFVYPIQLTNASGISVTVNSNTELEDAINAVVNDCSTAIGTLDLDDILVNGTWIVSYCYYDYNDETSYYNGYAFNFNSNGTSSAVNNNNTIEGEWHIENESSYQKLELNFEGGQLHDIETNWRVQEYTNTFIRLKHSNGNEVYYLNFVKQ